MPISVFPGGIIRQPVRGEIVQDIVVINPKGGCGKSTIAMNLAGFFACWGLRVGLVDLDPQETCLDWLQARPEALPRIEGWREATREQALDRRIDYRIIDVPSSRYDSRIRDIMEKAGTVIIPLMPSINDFRATARFLENIAEYQRASDGHTEFGIIANRVRNNTKSFNYLKRFIRQSPLACHAVLRDTQNYIRAAEQGLSIFELPRSMVSRDIAQWQRVIRWLCIDQSVTVNIPVPVANEIEF